MRYGNGQHHHDGNRVHARATPALYEVVPDDERPAKPEPEEPIKFELAALL